MLQIKLMYMYLHLHVYVCGTSMSCPGFCLHWWITTCKYSTEQSCVHCYNCTEKYIVHVSWYVQTLHMQVLLILHTTCIPACPTQLMKALIVVTWRQNFKLGQTLHILCFTEFGHSIFFNITTWNKMGGKILKIIVKYGMGPNY